MTNSLEKLSPEMHMHHGSRTVASAGSVTRRDCRSFKSTKLSEMGLWLVSL